MSVYLNLYRASLHLYPSDYRQEYGSEMTQLFTDMLAETSSERERIALLASSALETLKWSTPQVMAHTEAAVTATPAYIKTTTTVSMLCVVPFLAAMLYRLHMSYDHEAHPALLHVFIHTEVWYQAVLPALALCIVIITAIWSLVSSERYWHVSWAVRLRSAWHNSLIIFGLIGLLALGILS